LLGNKYNLEKFNCENYADYIQYEISYSKQVDNIRGVLAGAVLGLMVLAFAGMFSK
jgi:hypothetical protein